MKFLLLTSLILAAPAAFGQGRSVTFTALDAQSGDYSSGTTAVGGPVTLNAVTTVNVYSFLYATGNCLGSTIDVTGWGNGSQTSPSTFFDIYHNEVLNLSWSGIDHAQKVSGSATGDQDVKLYLRAKWYVYPGAVESTFIDTGGYVPYPGTNGAQTLGPSGTGGHIRFEYQRRADVTPGNGPGVYENVATLTIQRS